MMTEESMAGTAEALRELAAMVEAGEVKAIGVCACTVSEGVWDHIEPGEAIFTLIGAIEVMKADVLNMIQFVTDAEPVEGEVEASPDAAAEAAVN